MTTYDPVYTSIQLLPAQFVDGVESAVAQLKELDVSKAVAQNGAFNKVLITGMGGSRFPSIILYEFLKEYLDFPITINAEYRVPGWVDNKTLVILSSYSGNTEEVLRALDQVKGKTGHIIGFTTGGKLAKFLQESRLPVVVFDPTHNPSKQPRMAVGYQIGGMLAIWSVLGLFNEDALRKLFGVKDLGGFEQLRESLENLVSKAESDAQQLPQFTKNKQVILMSAEFLAGIGNMARNQLNETAKNIAQFHIIPEANHHLLEGFKNPEVVRKNSVVVLVESEFYTPRVRLRFDITNEVLQKYGIPTYRLKTKGATHLEHLFYSVGVFSFLSYFLALEYGEAPEKIPYVDYFKKRLAEVRA